MAQTFTVLLNFKNSNKRVFLITLQGPAPGLGKFPVSIQVGEERTESSPVVKDLGVLVAEKLHLSQQYALTAKRPNCALSCIIRIVTRRFGEGILPFYSVLVRPPPGVLHPGLQKKDTELLEQVQRRTPKIIRMLEHIPNEG